MDVVQEWSTKLAREVAPDEIDLAPLTGRAFAEGGKARQELLRPAKSAVGGFAADSMASVLPVLFNGLLMAGPVLISMLGTLTSKNTELYLACIKNALGLLELKMKMTGLRAPAAKAELLIPPGDSYGELRQVISRVGTELRRSGMSEEQADLVTFRVIRALLEQPQGGAAFVEAIARRP